MGRVKASLQTVKSYAPMRSCAMMWLRGAGTRSQGKGEEGDRRWGGLRLGLYGQADTEHLWVRFWTRLVWTSAPPTHPPTTRGPSRALRTGSWRARQ